MKFSPELLDNRALTEYAAASCPPYPERIGGRYAERYEETGALKQADGSILFRWYAPEAKRIVLKLTAFQEEEFPFVSDGKGMWSVTVPWTQARKGPQDLEFYLDGAFVIHPLVPVHFRTFKLVNFVEFPDPESGMMLLRDVPHGRVVREVYFSGVMQAWERRLVYLPPCYGEGGEYPVLYLQHGYSENENEWVYTGKAPYILDNLIAEGKAVPFVIVMHNGMERAPGEGPWEQAGFERMLTEECIPAVEKTYRVRRDKAGRGIAGLSMGSMQACIVGFRHPELFDWIGLFSGFMRGSVKADEPFADSSHLRMLTEDPEYIPHNYRLFFRSIGSADGLFRLYADDGKEMDRLGVDHAEHCCERVYEGLTHDWGAFRRAFRDFAMQAFR